MSDEKESRENATASPDVSSASCDTRISPGVPAAVSSAHDGAAGEPASSSMPSVVASANKRPDRSRLYGALSVALALVAAVAILAGAGYGAGFFGSAPDVSQGGETPAATGNSASPQGSDQNESSATTSSPASSGEQSSSAPDATQNADKPAASPTDNASNASPASTPLPDNATLGADSSPSPVDSTPSDSTTQAPAELVDVPDVSPSDDTAQTDESGKIKVSVSVDSSRIADYGIDPFEIDQVVELDPGASVYDALCALGVPISGNSYYVSAINGLAERQGGQGSGWTYSVNGDFPSKACGKYLLAGGEKIAWIYSTEKNPTLVMK